MSTARWLAIALVLGLSACAGSPNPAAAPATVTKITPVATGGDGAPPPREDGRLPTAVTPRRYALDLDVDPREPRFQGVVRLDVTVREATRHVVLHGRNLHVSKVVAHMGASGTPETLGTATARLGRGSLEPEELVLTFPAPLPAGEGTLTLTYDAPFSETLGGLYRVQEGTRWYAFTQFEATDARRAFPCFDEPSAKVPFEVTLRVPLGMGAFANTREVSREPIPGAGKDAVHFAPTLPLSTYLVAFAVGELDVVSAPLVNGLPPMRVLTAKGKGDLGRLALKETALLTKALADYFGAPYPYDKLDVVAVPNFGAGAMENAGLVTFREEILLVDEARASARARRYLDLILAHEIAHQWFGDLVTMAWWNDLWLNEGFASWMESKVVDQVHPTMRARLSDVADVYGVMDLDTLTSARAVRQPVSSTSEAEEAFDGLTYTKGGAILGMLEAWLGEATFQKGVRAYIQGHANGNATGADLFAALGAASGKDVAATAATFLDRTGVPSLEVTPHCNGKSLVDVELTQSPYRSLTTDRGAPAANAPTAGAPVTPWRIPACVTLEGSPRPLCTELTTATTKVLAAPSPAGRAAACPRWIYPNAGEHGYYRFSQSEEGFMSLAKNLRALDVGNRVGLLSNAWAQVRAGRLGSDTLLRMLPLFDGETERLVVEQVVGTLQAIRDTLVGDDAAEGAAFRRYAAARLAPHKKRLFPQGLAALGTAKGTPGATANKGPQGKAGEKGTASSGAGDDLMLLRRALLFALAEVAEDDDTLRDAQTLAQAWLKDSASVDVDLGPLAVELSARRAGPEKPTLEALRKAAREAKVPADRITALKGMYGTSQQASLEEALALLLTDEVRLQDVRHVAGATLGHRAARPLARAWVRGHWGELRTKFKGPLARALLGFVAAGTCTRASRDDAEGFLRAKAADIEGAARPIAEMLEASGLCAAVRDHAGPTATAALKSL